MTHFEIRVDGSQTPGYLSTRTFDSARNLADAVDWMLAHLPTGDDREQARRSLLRRLRHPEYNASTTTTEFVGPVHPRSTGRNYANSVDGEPRCVCGNRRGSHDIDGQRDDCDGYVEAK